jgi:hypothetical protein
LPQNEHPGLRKAGIAKISVHRNVWVIDGAAGLFLVLFALLKAYGLAPSFSDEGIYFYMCQRMAEGALPYQDFFFAHPPFHLIPGALLMSVAGYSLETAKALPAAATLLAGMAIYSAGRRGTPMQGLVAMGLFLFSHDLLRASSHYTGAAEATALLAWALERALAEKPRAAGLLAGAAGLVAFYAIPAAAAISFYLLLKRSHDFKRYMMAFSGLFLGINLLCVALFRERYWDPVIRYHFMKPAGGAGNLESVLRAITTQNIWIVWGLPVFLIAWVLIRNKTSPRKRGRSDPWLPSGVFEQGFAGAMVCILHLAFFFMINRVYTFYFLPGLAGLALAGGAGYVSLLRGASGMAEKDASKRSRRSGVLALTALLLLLFSGEWVRSRLEARVIDKPAGEVLRTYAWKDSPLPDAVDSVIRAGLWHDDRIAGGWTTSATRYLWHESRRFEAPAVLAGMIVRQTPATATIFGDSVATPQIALISGRKIINDEADTNAMRFRSGITPPRQMIAKLEASPPDVVIAAPRRGFFNVAEMRAWVNANYHVTETFQDPIYGPYSIYIRNSP